MSIFYTDLGQAVDKLGPYLLGPNDTPENGIYTGDARELSKAIPDESVDLIFTDPVYDRIEDYAWLAETAARVLKQDRACLVWQGQPWIPQTLKIIERSRLNYRWIFSRYRTGGRDPRYAFGWCKWMPLLWYSKGQGLPKPVPDLLIESDNGTDKRHRWQKAIRFSTRMVYSFTDKSAIILDPFCGGGTVPAVCKMLGRRYLAFEIDPDTAEDARKRVRNTQLPLFVPQAEQMELEL
jgi:DNA modification methylase